MSSSYLTSDPDMTLIFNVYKFITLVMPMSKYQVSTMKETEVTLFSMIEGKLREDQINSLHCSNSSYLIFSVLSK